jgi:uncharacterized protein (DUF1501 family)
MKRRMILKSGGLAMFAVSAGALPMFLGRAAQAAPEAAAFQRRKVLVTIFQRFGMDGLMAATPYADERLAKLRPSLMLPKPGSGSAHARLDLDGQFGLHPAFAPMLPMFRDGSLAIVHAVGSPHNTRSHSEAQLWWESGTPGDRRTTSGWLNRALGAAQESENLPLRAVSTTGERPRILYGDQATASISDLGNIALTLDAAPQGILASLRSLYQKADNPELRTAGANSFEFARILEEAQAGRRSTYPTQSALGESLREIAHLIKANVGLQVAFAESRFAGPNDKGSWDTHSNEAAVDGPFPIMANDLSKSLAAFWEDLGELRDDVMVVTLTDFGRNVVENAGIGTDHGRATAMFVLGHSVLGGRVHGSLPERFERDALEDQIDLPVTTDFRAVISTLTASQLGVQDDTSVFPNWDGNRLPIA